MAKYAVILLAAGQSSRFKDKEKKPFADLDGRAVWLRSLEIFSIRDEIESILIAISAEDQELFDRRYRANVAFLSNARVVHGGSQRSDSVMNCLARCPADVDFVLVHDTARACLTAELVDKVCAAAERTGAATLAVPVTDTIKKGDAHRMVTETVPRENLWLIQTPQVFSRKLLLDAYAQKDNFAGNATDCCSLVEALGHPVELVESDHTNIKITTKQDIHLAAAIIKSRPKPKDKSGLHPFANENMW